jgi:hypothetical protein
MRAATWIQCAIMLVFGPAAAATTLKVPGEYATIQGAVDQAGNGDTILVAPGTYAAAQVLFDTKGNVRLLSSGGRAATTLNGDLALANSSKIVVSGFTINGQVRISCNTLSVVAGCDVAGSGASGIVIAGCPGGAYSDVEITGNRIRGHSGHGIEAELSGGKATIAGNEIRDNGASGVSIAHSYSEVAGNVIHDNAGNGIEIVQGTSAMHGNTIVGNAGAGIRVSSGDKPYTQTIADGIVAFNGTAGLFGDAGGIYNVSCCDVWSNGAAGGFNYAGAIADRTGVEGNISVDPLFCDRAAGNLSLLEGSPALAQSCGAMGARGDPGCAQPDAARRTTWGDLKAIYRK